MNLLQLRDATRQRAGVSFDTTAISDAVNEALQEVSTERDWDWLETTWRFASRDGVGTYSLPFGIRKVVSVTLGGRDLAYIGGRDSAEGAMHGWTIEDGNKLVLTPDPPGAALVVVRLYRDEPELDADAAEPLLPVAWHRSYLVNRAAAVLLERIGEHDRANRLRADADNALRRMIRTARTRKGPGRIRIRPGSPV